MDVFQSIRETNIIDYGQKFEEWAPRILVDQYSDRTHFLFELLQNAEDAEATEIEIQLMHNGLTLIHDGRDFTENDVRGICGVSASTKRNAPNRIGRFGIGFKSVYAYTNTPHIMSGSFDFEIKNLIMPYQIKKTANYAKTIIELPFDSADTKECAYKEISRSLRQNLNSDCMLTLSHVRRISYAIEGSSGSCVLTKSTRLLGRGVQDITLTEAVNGGTPAKTQLLAFVSQSEKPSMIAYRIGVNSDGVKGVLPSTNPFLYAFFPTAVETHQHFYIHAPFDTTPARDNIKNNEYNSKLVASIAQLFSDSVLWLRDHRYLSLKFFTQVYPLYCYPENSLLTPIYQAGIELIHAGNQILPTMKPNEFGSVSNVFLPESQNIIQCFDDAMLPALVNNPNAHWLDKMIASEPARSFREYLQTHFSLRALGWKSLVGRLSAPILEKKPDVWLIALMRNIQPYCFSERSDDRIAAKDIPLVRLESGKHCLPKSADGKPQVYLNNPDSCKLKIKGALLDDFFAKSFYSRVLEIPNYDIFEEIRTDILPQYNSPEKIEIRENIAHLLLIFKAYEENPARVSTIIEGKRFLLTSKGWETPERVFLPDCYFKTSIREYAVLKQLDVAWLSSDYRGKISTDDLLRIGCHATIQSDTISEQEYGVILKKYEPDMFAKYSSVYCTKTYHTSRDGFSPRRTITNIGNVINHFSVEASIALAEYVANNLSIYKLKGTVIAANDAAFRGKATVTIDDLPSAIGLILSNSAWIYCEGESVAKRPGDIRRSEIDRRYEECAAALLNQLPFIHEDSIVQELIGHYDSRYQAFLTDLLNNKEALSEAFNTYTTRKNRQKAPEERTPDDALKNNPTVVPGSTQGDDKKSASVPLVEEDDELVEEIVQDIISRSTRNKGIRSEKNDGSQKPEKTHKDVSLPTTDVDQDEIDVDEDDFTRPSIDYAKKIEQAKKKSAGEIDRIARYEYLNRKAKSAAKYSFEWFCALLEMESLVSAENSLNSKEISISFGKVELEPGTSRTLVLKQPSRYIPQYMEDLADIPLVLHMGGKTKTVAIEVSNVQSYTLRVKLRTNAEIDDIDLSKVEEARIDAHNPVFLVEALRKQFIGLDFDKDYDMQANLCHNIEFVFGPPGTGKTTHLAKNVILPLYKKKNVKALVLTPTNKAADVLTRRVVDVAGPDIDCSSWLIRFGATGDETLENTGVFKDKTFDVRTLQKSVTITTIARFSYDYFMPEGERLYLSDLNWDYIIIDEASMISLASILLPLYKKTPEKFIITGDPFQIEPITTVENWKNENIYTLINLNSFTAPKTIPVQYPVTLLTTQYRSVPAVGEIFSQFSYGGILQHYRDASSQRPLNIGDQLDINTLNIIKFPVSKYESIYRAKTLQHRSPYQVYSALFSFEFVTYLAKSIAEANPKEHFEIGIIAPYRAQADLISKLLMSASIPCSIGVNVGTIHSFQGDECDIILAVFNSPPSISASKDMFLNKTNIVNVAISRARDYLFVVMPDDDTENINNLRLIKKVERIIKSSRDYTEFDSHYLEGIMFGTETYLEENSFATSHQNVNVYGLPEKRYEIRSEDSAVDIQVHK